ncbi:MAG TPA: hypothetical protein VH518_17305 [Tepidisphaeraceae bacterium]|jgi:hypothetical protein
MVVSTDVLWAQGQFPTYDPFAQPTERAEMFVVQCRLCGFEPEETVVPPRLCPKCHGQSWERFAKPGSLLINAERYS